jgi:hypothetical protein
MVTSLLAVGIAAAGATACGSESTACVTDANGNYTCDTYGTAAYAYSYDYSLDSYDDDVGDVGLYLSTTKDGGAQTPDAGMNAVPELLQKARAGARFVNAGVVAVLTPIQALVKTKPTRSGGTLTFGPTSSGNASYLYVIKKLSDNKSFTWKLEAGPPSGVEQMKIVAGGTIDISSGSPRVARSTLGVDGDALAAADTSLHATGVLLLGATDDGTTNILRFRLKGYTPDSTMADPVDAAALGIRHDKDENQSRVVLKTNLAETPTDAQELVIVKLHWRKADGARADAVAVGGDVPAGQELRISTCVPASLSSADASTVSVTCDATDASCTSSTSALMCSAAFQSDTPPTSDPIAEDVPANAPALPQVPTSVPNM